MTFTVCFRIADYPSPLRVTPSESEARYHDVGDIVQYLSLHPLGAFAEFVKRERPGVNLLRHFRHRLWAVRVPLQDAVTITFTNAHEWGITPAELVSVDYEPCQALARRLQSDGITSAIVPSAALPGATNVVIFGPRVPLPFTAEPVRESDLPVTLAAEDATVLQELEPLVVRAGDDHPALLAALHQEAFQFVEPEPRS